MGENKMKMIDKFHIFGALVLISFLLGFISYNVVKNDNMYLDKINVNGTVQYFPMKIDSDYKVINAKLDQFEITVWIEDVNTGDVYESTLPSDEIESLVCENEYSEVYDAMEKGWDCSTEDKAVKSMIKEVAEQTIDLIKEGL